MKKIISLFQRNYEGDRLVRDELVPGAEWVAAGEGLATLKWDGSACLYKGGLLWRRYDAKAGRTPPARFEPAQDPDPKTGHWPGWIPVSSGNPADRWHMDAWSKTAFLEEGATYEAVGPHFQGNPHRFSFDQLIRHGNFSLRDAPRDFSGLREFLGHDASMEGLVWHHPDGRMVKIKRRDFGFPWPPPPEGERRP